MTIATEAVARPGTVWVRSACAAAFDLPAYGAEWERWAVRGLSEVALGCALAGDPEVTAEFDAVVRAARLGAAGPAAARLRRVRALLGPVPDGYPDAEPGPAVPRPKAIEPGARRAAGALCAFCTGVLEGLGGRSPRTGGGCAGPLVESTAGALRWGAGLRPSPAPCGGLRIVPSPGPGLVWRSWMRLAAATGPETVVVERPPLAPPLSRLVWRGLHDGAHLDHMAALARTDPSAPLPIEFGAGLLLAEAYAMAVEIVAAAGPALAENAPVAREICHGLLERVGRLPGGGRGPTPPAGEFGGLPTLAAAYVAGPLRLLAGATGGLPPDLASGLRRGWERAVERSRPAARLDRVARALL
ncbi:MAG TPA: hypothetical protein VFV01_36315 [Spirillospora sp.]|nr:hypothetical protein [Spirillospora sp.]